MANITSAGTESLLEKQNLQANGSSNAHTADPLLVNDKDALNGDEEEDSDEYDAEEEQQAAEDEEDEYDIDDEDGGYEDEDEDGEHEVTENGKPNLTALLLGDPNSTVGNGNDDDDDDEGDYEEDEEQDGDAEEDPEPISPSTAKKRSIDDLEETDSNEAKKVKA